MRHRLPHRLRIDFGERLSPEQMRSVLWLLEHHFPNAVLREAASGHGLVISSRSISEPLEDPLPRVQAMLDHPIAQLPEPPPPAWQQWVRQSRQGTLNVLMALAIAGWALPILPGTPFFLLAWWMGWRPEPKPSQADPADQSNSTTSQGASIRADRQVS